MDCEFQPSLRVGRIQRETLLLQDDIRNLLSCYTSFKLHFFFSVELCWFSFFLLFIFLCLSLSFFLLFLILFSFLLSNLVIFLCLLSKFSNEFRILYFFLFISISSLSFKIFCDQPIDFHDTNIFLYIFVVKDKSSEVCLV